MDAIATKPPLYHYCGVEAFFGIIESKSIWLSSSAMTNDFWEEKWIERVINEVVANKPSIKEAPIYQTVAKVFFQNRIRSYIACFSEEADLLSQWRAYADNGAGVSIGFNREYFGIANFVPSATAVYSPDSLGLSAMVYDQKVQHEIVDGFFLKPFNDDAMAFDAAMFLVKLSYVFKNHAFQEEREWRIMHTPLVLGDSNNNTIVEGVISKLQYRTHNSLLIPYFTLSFGEKRNIEPIEEVVLGPKCGIASQTMRDFLSFQGMREVKVRNSVASYR